MNRRWSTSAAKTAQTTPTLGTPTGFVLDTASDVSTYTQAHTRATGAGLHVAGVIRSNADPSPTVSTVTYDGVAMTIRAQDKVDGSVDLISFVATMDPGTGSTGSSANVVVTLSSVEARDFAGFVVDVVGTGGAQQGVAQSTEDAGATTESVNITPTNALSLLVGAGGCIDGSGTVTAGGSWTSVTTAASNTDANACEAVLQTRATGATSQVACDVGFSASRVDRGITCAEWLPG